MGPVLSCGPHGQVPSSWVVLSFLQLPLLRARGLAIQRYEHLFVVLGLSVCEWDVVPLSKEGYTILGFSRVGFGFWVCIRWGSTRPR